MFMQPPANRMTIRRANERMSEATGQSARSLSVLAKRQTFCEFDGDIPDMSASSQRFTAMDNKLPFNTCSNQNWRIQH